jgi:hypothetical protein
MQLQTDTPQPNETTQSPSRLPPEWLVDLVLSYPPGKAPKWALDQLERFEKSLLRE